MKRPPNTVCVTAPSGVSWARLPLALACAAMCGSAASQTAAPDWSKAGTTTAPATTLVRPAATSPAAPTTIPPTTAPSTAPKAGSAFTPKAAVTPMPTVATPAPATAPTGTLAPKTAANATATTGSKDLFKLDDRAIIIVGGKPVAAGDVKQQLKADIATQAGAPKLMTATPRKLDYVAMNVLSGSPSTPPGVRAILAAVAASQKSPIKTALTPKAGSVGPGANHPGTQTTLAGDSAAQSYLASQCVDKGPPKIEEVDGKLIAGSRVTIWGTCFGDKPGRVEVIGQFPGGKLVPAFSAWDKTSITIEVPATIRGASDHTVAVSVVTADNKTSAAMQAQFVAARERVEVPDWMWAGGGSYELAATVETVNTATNVTATNPAAGGRLPKSVRINPQCSLDNMDVTTLAGAVTSINGFGLGPPNEANVTLDWVGTCIGTKTTTHHNYFVVQVGDDISIVWACRVALQARTWAYCPAGVAP